MQMWVKCSLTCVSEPGWDSPATARPAHDQQVLQRGDWGHSTQKAWANKYNVSLKEKVAV